MAINTQKVIVGGLAAGVVMNVIDFVVNMFIVGDRMKNEMNAVAPGLADKMMTTSAMVTYIVMDFVLGIMLVWLYAAIRPRFGPGPGTAMKGAVFAWVLVSLAYSGYLMSGMTSATTWCMLAVAGLINFAVGSWIGAMMYSEPMA